MLSFNRAYFLNVRENLPERKKFDLKWGSHEKCLFSLLLLLFNTFFRIMQLYRKQCIISYLYEKNWNAIVCQTQIKSILVKSGPNIPSILWVYFLKRKLMFIFLFYFKLIREFITHKNTYLKCKVINSSFPPCYYKSKGYSHSAV